MDLLKLQNTPIEDLNEEQIEALELMIAGRTDPVLFLEKALGLDLYEQQKIWIWATTHTQKEKCYNMMMKRGIFFTTQENLLAEMDELYSINKHILAVGNQIGKTFLTACKHAWSLYYKVGIRVSPEDFLNAEYKTLNISPHSDQSNKCREYIRRMYRGQMVFYDPETDTTRTNKLSPIVENFVIGENETLGEIRFANNAIFWSKSTGQDKATSRAGEQFGLISFDECAQSRHLMAEINMLLSRIIRYGYSFDLISSPEVEKPSHQAYYRLVKKGLKLEDKWYAMTKIGLDQNIFIHPEQKEKAKENIRTTDLAKYKQMIEGEFVMTGDRFLPLQAVAQVFAKDRPVRKIHAAVPGRRYLLMADWGMSDTGDPSWFFVLDWTDFITEDKIDLVYHEKVVGGSPAMQLATLRVIFQNFGGHGTKDAEDNWDLHPVKFISDTNSLGGVMIKKMLFDLKPIPFGSHGGQKDQMLAALQGALTYKRKFSMDEMTGEVTEHNPNFGKLRSYYIEELEEQLGGYKVDDKKLEQDAVMSLGMGIWYLERKIPRNPNQKLELNPLSRYNSLRRQP